MTEYVIYRCEHHPAVKKKLQRHTIVVRGNNYLKAFDELVLKINHDKISKVCNWF